MEDDNIRKLYLRHCKPHYEFDKSEEIARHYLDSDAKGPCSIQNKTVFCLCF